MKITNEDNMQLMARYEDNHFDLAIVDPPYGIGESKKKRENTKSSKWKKPTKKIHNPKDWDLQKPTKEYFNELFRVSKNQIIWGGNYFSRYLPSSMGWVFWDKKNGNSDFSDGELAFTSFNKGLRKFEWLWNGFQKQKPENKIHPTQKPIKLYEWLLMNYAKEGDKILDTHLGSGSIAIACHNLKFDLTACELDKEYFDAAIKRINQHKQQLRLW
jgi:site-specific DNA-methyltransferase (adenine-specific)